MSTVLELRGVSKTRGEGPRATQALGHASLSLSKGELVLLEGPSGSGKTTLLSLAAGLLTPDRGVVLLCGIAIDARDPVACRARRRRDVGFVFQRPSLLAGLSVRENVLLAASLAGLSRDRASAETARVLESLGLSRLAERRPDELSGGEEQRVAVARALVHRPAVVLADEPTGSLDAAAGRAVAHTLAALARARGAAVLVATHDDRLGCFACRRLRLLDGRLQVEKAA
ncbi:MAG TPA: ATP-binding cassette domain-containing protein [Thermoanaerobaculia bacterium]|nr:ATP-binding cassette domain-containing protein [Thermoanaerobaculia bacterium]